MTRRMRRAARTLTTLAAVGILLVPSTQALADGTEPQPVDWPTVAPPDTHGQATEPRPVDWPAPAQYEG